MKNSFKIKVGRVVLMLVTSAPIAFVAVGIFAILYTEFYKRRITVVVETMLSGIFLYFLEGKRQ